MSEAEINSVREENRQLKDQLMAAAARERAIREAARNVALDRDGWRAAALRMRSDCAHVE
jgi:hypothetical protein